MSVPDKSINPRLLSAAMEEFLDKGYENASLNDICRKAGVTTGALYKRYKGKEDLFGTLVAGVISDMEKYITSIPEGFLKSFTDRELYDSLSMPAEMNLEWFRLLYEQKEAFTLLVKCSSGTRYADFHREWAERMNEADYMNYLEARKRGMTDKVMTKEEMYVLTTAVWTLFYEPFVRDFTWEQFEEHAQYLHDFINWHKVLGIKEPEIPLA